MTGSSFLLIGLGILFGLFAGRKSPTMMMIAGILAAVMIIIAVPSIVTWIKERLQDTAKVVPTGMEAPSQPLRPAGWPETLVVELKPPA